MAASRGGFRFDVDEKSSAWEALKRTVENLKANEGAFVKVGVIGAKAAAEHEQEKDAEGKRSPLTNAQLAMIHEFGAPSKGIPARPFILGTFVLNRAKYMGLLKTKILPGIYLAKITAEKGLAIMGQVMSSDIRNRMVDGAGIPPPNSPATIAAKKRRGKWNAKGRAAGAEPRPLINMGRLRNSISYGVVMDPGDASDTWGGGEESTRTD